MNDESNAYRPSGPIDPVAAQIAAFFGADPGWNALKTNPIAETRAAFKAGTPMTGEPAMEHVEDFRVPVAGGDIALRFYRPGPQPSSIIVWAHGGGFALGSIDEIDNFSRLLAATTGSAVASVEYRLAPQHPFPTAVEDMLSAVRWVVERQAELAGRSLPIVVGGDSAGANLATVVTRKLHETGTASIAANVLAYPSTDHGGSEMLRRFDPPFLTVAEVSWFLDQYQPDPARREHPDFAPRYATNLGTLPPTLIITAEHDIITEQAEAYGRQLEAEGVEVRASRHPGMIHGFLTMDVFFPSAAGQAIREIDDFIADVVKLERRMDPLARLIAIEEIKQLKARYFRTMDMRDWDGMAEVFCRDALFDCSEGFQITRLDGTPVGPVGPVTRGRDAIMAWISDAFANQTSAHHGHCHEVTIDSATEAHGVIAMEDYILGPDRETRLYQGAGHYHERYRFEEGAWRIAETKLTRLFGHL